MMIEGKQRAREKIQSFTDLYAWQAAHKLVITIYRCTKEFPTEEKFGLTNQLRRAAVSVTSNIAEGFSRQLPREKVQFYYQALSSLTEVQSQLLVARDIQYLPMDEFGNCAKQTIIVSKLINGLIKKIKNEDIAA